MQVLVSVVSLGCAKNLVDSENLLGLLQEAGHRLTVDLQQAEAIVVNTCSFITPAKQESVNKILEMAVYKEANCRHLIVAGCLAQEYGEELMQEIPAIDVLLGTGSVARVVDALAAVEEGKKVVFLGREETGALPRVVSTPSHTAYLKIAEGCSNRCTFCLIPRLRGPYRSRLRDEIIQEAQDLAARGARELVLIAQDSTFYGTDLAGTSQLPSLLRDLAAIQGLEWIRVMYGHPEHLTDAMLDVMAGEEKICTYLDLPLQHVAAPVLRRMGRKGSAEALLAQVEKIRRRIPDVTLRSTFIVGFPGEDDVAFQELLDFLAQARLDWVGAFAYSPQDGTTAAYLPDTVPDAIKEERRQRLMSLQQEITARVLADRWQGRVVPVLIEGNGRRPGSYRGRTRGQAPEVDGITWVKSDRPLAPGTIVPVRVTNVRRYDLGGEVEGPVPAIP